jgi:hypothetical protein
MEDKMGEMLRTSMFGSRQQQQALKEKLRSEPCELTEEEVYTDISSAREGQ